MTKVKLSAGLCVLLYFLVFAGSAPARVSGVCSNCHTMHNSQNGSAVDADGPSGNLLNNDCVGCHSSSTSNTITTLGTTRIPIVFNTSQPTYPPDGSASSTLAGGNFYWVVTNGDAYGHNVLGISSADSKLTHAPGPAAGCVDCHNSLAVADVVSEQETGCSGCHVPRHHADDSAVVVGETGGWYRFLGDNTWMTEYTGLGGSGVMGIEDADWEQNPLAGHNAYQGTTTIYAREFGQFNHENSIGSFCAGCHGDFHYKMNEGQGDNTSVAGNYDGAWIRHPSDVAIPLSGEYQEYSDGGTYNPLVPVAKGSALVSGDANFSALDNATTYVVTCISCHRPHGSPYPDMLRWDYENGCKTGTPNSDCGCFTCHSVKDAAL